MIHDRGIQTRRSLATVVLVVMALVAAACGGDTPDAVSCSLDRSEFGPLLEQGKMDQATATEFMESNGIAEWLVIEGRGDWGPLWDHATAELGDQIHVDLTWIDVQAEVHDLAEGAASLPFDVRVSRSYQGKVEGAQAPLYEPMADALDLDAASCTINRVILGHEDHPVWLDLTDQADIA